MNHFHYQMVFGKLFFLYITSWEKTICVFSFKSRRTGVDVQQTDLYNSEIIQSTPISHGVKPRKHFERHQNENHIWVLCTCVMGLLTLAFILGQINAQSSKIMYLFRLY